MQFKSISGALGAEVSGVNLADDLSEKQIETIRAGFHEHIALVFRDQDVPPHKQVAFTEIFGPVEPHPLRPRRHLEEAPGIMVLENRPGTPGPRNDFWHSDLSHLPEPPTATCLHAIDVPTGRGDTMVCNSYLAYENLSEGMQQVLGEMKAVHSGEATRQRHQSDRTGLPVADVPPDEVHPVVRAHPETGRKALYINPFFTTRFEDMTVEESQPMLAFLYAQATKPEHVYRHQWAPGDVLIWDNRCTMHYAVKDYDENNRRYIHRATASGNRPF